MNQQKNAVPDVNVIGSDFTIFLFVLNTDKAQQWVDENVPDPMWYGDGIAVEPCYARDLVEGMLEGGLHVE